MGPDMKAASPFVLLAALAGCATVGDEASERRVTYACNYGPNLIVSYGKSAARIESPNGTVTLARRSVASGFLYQSATHSLQGKGNEISYKDRQMAPKQCRAVEE